LQKFYATLALIALIAVVIGLPAPARADSIQIEGVTVTNADISQLFKAFHTALQPNDKTIPLVVSMKSPSEMPAYDQQWHYAGIRNENLGAPTMQVWVSDKLTGTDLQNALVAAFSLALTDGGYGGRAFKQLYDIFAAKDAQLPSNAPDPFINRQQFAAALVHLMQSAEK